MYEHVVVPAEWVAERLEQVRIVDVREPWEYDGIGHLPGAASVPFDSFRAEEHEVQRSSNGSSERPRDGEEGMLPGADVFASLLGEAGIEREDHIVAYDDTHGVFAARFIVTCELYGHDPSKLHLLDGDYSAWSREYRVSREPLEVAETTYDLERPDSEETPLISREDVTKAIETTSEGGEGGEDRESPPSGTVLVDTRQEWEFEEGHIPGAIRLDWRTLVDDESRGLKPDDELERILEARGITRDRRVILYCNTARRISHTYLVLRHLGYEDLAFYEGSLTEWEREGGPIETA